MTLKQLLQESGLVIDLSQNQLEKIEAIANIITYNRGDILISEGGRDRDLYLIAEGKVSVNLLLPGSLDKMEAIISMRSGQMFGEFSLLDSSPRSASVRAESDGFVYKFNADEFINLCKEDTELGYIVMRNIAILLSSRLRETTLLMRNTLLW